jgi:hypothetical protein
MAGGVPQFLMALVRQRVSLRAFIAVRFFVIHSFCKLFLFVR